ncbi:MAG: copper-binding protein [Gallionella sp.]|nr:copper-binding protein [Gallionella sp.]
MQKILTGSLFLAFLVNTGAFAAEQHDHGMGNDGMSQMNPESMKAMHDDGQTMPLSDGVVKKVDVQNGKITLAHGEIANVKMPAMTMSYRIKQAQQLKSIHAGDKVRFAMDRVNDDYIVTHIEMAK